MTITIIRQAPLSSEALIRHTQPNVTLHVTPVSRLIQHPGTLYIADECLSFFSEASNAGFSISYPSIIIHAIARESLVGPNIYCQLEGTLESASGSGSNGVSGPTNEAEDEDEDEDEDAILELSFVPADVSSLDTIYEHLSYCASLHQDEEAEDDYDMDQDEYEEMDDLPTSSSATAIGYSTLETDQDGSSPTDEANATGVEAMPMIDLENGEWYTGNPESDSKFELSEEGQVMVGRWQQNLENRDRLSSSSEQNPLGKRGRQEGEVEGEDQPLEEGQQQEQDRHYSEEELQEARSKMWRAY